MNVTLRQLQIFAGVVEAGGFTRAAEQLHLTQPAVSQQIRQLTEAVGEPLIEMMGRRLTLTPVGEALLDTWRAMSQQWQQFEETVQAEKGLHHGVLRLSAVSTAKYFIPRVLGPFCERYPGIDVRLEVVNRERIIERIQRNADDLYVMTSPPTDLDLVREPFLDNPLVMIAPCAHPLVGRPGIQVQDLAGERFIMREPGASLRIAVEQFLQQRGIALNVRMELGDNEAIKQAVAGGLGLSVVSRLTLHRDPQTVDGVAILDVDGLPIHLQWELVYLQQKRLSRAAQAFLAVLRDWVPAYLDSMGMEGENRPS